MEHLISFISEKLVNVKLPKGKTTLDCAKLIALGHRKAGWNPATCTRFTNSLKERKEGFKGRYYIWFLLYYGVKYCPSCKEVKVRDEFRNNLTKTDGKQTKCSFCESKYIKDNSENYAHNQAKRRALKIKATPAWADLEKIKDIYKNCPSGYHVDHIVPLNSDIVCGLHTADNLQYLLAADNISKSNKFVVV